MPTFPQQKIMFVVKRNHGTGVEKKEPVSFDRITERIVGLAEGLSEHVDAVQVAQKVCALPFSLLPCIKTSAL